MKQPDWRGVYTAMTTKFDPSEAVDLDAVKADVAFQIAGGVHGIICCGSLGEASTLTADEKISIAASAMEAAGDDAPVVLTIAEDSTAAAARLAERAAELGLAGLMVLPAMRYVSTPRETIVHFRTVADATDLDIMVYNNPVSYSVDVTPEMFADLADEPKFEAIKESSGDLRRITDIFNAVGEDRYAVSTGVDDLALESLVLGAVGWVAGLVCAFPRETVAIYDHIRAERYEEARRIYRWFMPLLHLDISHRFVQNIKLVEAAVRGTSTVVRKPRLEIVGNELERVWGVVSKALETRREIDSVMNYDRVVA